MYWSGSSSGKSVQKSKSSVTTCFCFVMLERELGAGVKRVVEVLLFLQALGFHRGREGGDALRMRANIRQAGERVRGEIGPGVGDQVVGEDVLHQLQSLVKEVLFIDARVIVLYLREAASQDSNVGRECAESRAGRTPRRRRDRR